VRKRIYYFMYDGFVEVMETAEEAKMGFKASMEEAQSEAYSSNEWPEWTDQTEWGELVPLEKVQSFPCEEEPGYEDYRPVEQETRESELWHTLNRIVALSREEGYGSRVLSEVKRAIFDAEAILAKCEPHEEEKK